MSFELAMQVLERVDPSYVEEGVLIRIERSTDGRIDTTVFAHPLHNATISIMEQPAAHTDVEFYYTHCPFFVRFYRHRRGHVALSKIRAEEIYHVGTELLTETTPAPALQAA